jgi:hypothetical protein
VRVREALQSHLGTRLPIGLAAAASASIGASEHSFWPVRHGASLLTQGGGINGTFDASGPRLRVDRGTLALSLGAVGRGRRVERVSAVLPAGAGNQVAYRHGSVTEFYRNGPNGLEQGFIVGERPRAGAGSLVLVLSIGGSLIPKQVGRQVLFQTHAGSTALHYEQLVALDATSRRLPATMRVRNGSLELRIDDSHTRYPLRIDPFIQQGPKLTGTAESGPGQFGFSVALSADGETALVGGFADHEFAGAAWVFTRSGETWAQQGGKLTGSGAIGPSQFGQSVRLSSDGNTALIGGPRDNGLVGAAWVFTRSGTTWSQQGAKLTGSGEIGNEAAFGRNVALSPSGNTALIGGFRDNKQLGAAWVFTRSGETWAQQAKLTASGETGEGLFGWSLGLSSDGNTALIGGPLDKRPVGAAWVFTRSGETWAQQAKLTASGGSEDGEFGYGVALSADGNTALIGGPADKAGVGAALVFTRSGEMWTQQGPKLTGAGATKPAWFGYGVALSSDGNTALIGGFKDNSEVGAAWVFTRSGSTWTQQGPKLTGGAASGPVQFGLSVALSSDGNTALIGGFANGGAVGAAWVFLNAPRYYSNGVLAGSAPTTTITWGTVTLKTVVGGSGEVTCHTVGAATIDNPMGAGAGVGSTQMLATFDCESTTCPFTSVVTAESLPWPSALEYEGSVIRVKTTGVKVKTDCQKEGKSEGSETFVGADQPSFRHGTSALHPGFLEYDAGAGSLENEGSKGSVLGKLEGELKVLGYDEQELINVN